MGGSGGGGRGGYSRPLEDLVKEANTESNEKAYGAEVNQLLKDTLKEFNDRDVPAQSARLEILKKAIEADVEGTIDLVAGGSIKKHTYVDGISDIDTLALVNKSDLKSDSPAELIKYFADKVQKRLPNTVVTCGDMAVTVRYSDGHEIQILPALKTPTGYRVPSARGGWSNVVRPDAFAKKLTAVNQQNGGNVIPAIKLFKGLVNDRLPDESKLSGYHIESLAINAFKQYSGRRTYKDMVTHLTKYAVEAVKTPIADSTGQTLHVDDYFGSAGSSDRKRCSAALSRVAAKLQSADRNLKTQIWKELQD